MVNDAAATNVAALAPAWGERAGALPAVTAPRRRLRAPRLVHAGLGLAAVLAPATAQAKPPGDACPPGMGLVPGGTFPMGDANGLPDEKPVTPVTLPSFCLDLTEVTVRAYASCAREGLCTPAHARPEWRTLKALQTRRWSAMCNRDRADRADYPVNCVTQDEAERYCAARGLRLPTEAEWEYAARGGAEARAYPWGDTPPTVRRANLCGGECQPVIAGIRGMWDKLYPDSDGWVATAPVGSFPEGDARWGQHDMSGNVCEFVSGLHCPYDKPGCDMPRLAMVRGDHFLGCILKKTRAARRNTDDITHRSPDVGFRCAVDAGVTDPRPAVPLARVTVLPELPSWGRVEILAAGALLAGAAIAGFGGAASAIVVALLIWVGQIDPKTASATGFAVVAAAHAASLAAPAVRRRVDARAGLALGGAAFAAAFVGGALARFVPDRVAMGAVVVVLVVLAVEGARRVLRADRAAGGTEAPGGRPPWFGGAIAGAASGLAGVTLTTLHEAWLRRRTALAPEQVAATASAAALLTALGGVLGFATHTLPDLGLGVVMAASAAVGGLLRGLAAPRARSRAGQAVLALALLGLGLIVCARELLPQTWFPNL